MIYFQKQVDALMAEKESRIAELVADLQTTRLHLAAERKRAENAIDQLLAKQGNMPISEPVPREPKETKKEYLGLLSVVGEDHDPKVTKVHNG